MNNNQNQSDFNTIIQNGYSIKTGEFLSRGWELCKPNLGLFIVFGLISYVIELPLSLLPIAGIIGIIKLIGSVLIGNMLFAGGLVVAFKTAKNQAISFGNFFRGFQTIYFLPLVLISLVNSLLIILLISGLFEYIGFFGSGLLILTTDKLPLFSPSTLLLRGITLLRLIVPFGAIYLGISYFFTIPLMIDRRMKTWSAMEVSRKLVGQNWFGILGFVIVLLLINIGGVLLFGIGLLIAAPLATCAIAAAYEDIIGLRNFEPS